MKKKSILIVALLAIVVLLSLQRPSASADIPVSSDETIVYDDVLYVDSTSNLFSIIGHKLSSLIEKVFSVIFSIINKLLEFAFGI